MWQWECVLPAVDDHGPHSRNLLLLVVHLCEEAEDFVRLLGDAVIRPAQVLKVPDLSHPFSLKHTVTHTTVSTHTHTHILHHAVYFYSRLLNVA